MAFGKGRIPWNKGLSKETDEIVLKYSMSNKGKRHSKESLKKMSESKKGKMVGEKNPFYGKTHSEESLRKMSEVHKGKPSPLKGRKTGRTPWNKGLKGVTGWVKGRKQTPESIRKMVETRMKNGSYKHTEEQKRKIGLASKGKMHSEETKKRMSLVQKKLWANPERKKKMSKVWTGRKHSEESCGTVCK